MARQLRIHFEGAWYHVMNRGINRANLFFNDNHRNKFLNLLGKTKDIYGIEIHAYCLMSNHYHLIIHTPRGNISQAMKYLNSSYAQFVNSSMKRDGPLFRGRFKAIIISADEYLIRLSRYIHLNPLEAKMVTSLLKYKWSSYLSYIGKTEPQEWLTTLEIVDRFGKSSFEKHYRKFVESRSDPDLDKFYQNNKHEPVLAGDDFRRMIDEYVKSDSLSVEIVGADHILSPPTIHEITDVVSNYFDIDVKSIFEKKYKHPARQIAIYICRELGGYPLLDISKAIGNIEYKGISKAIWRVKNNTDQLKVVNALIKKIKGKMKRISEKSEAVTQGKSKDKE